MRVEGRLLWEFHYTCLIRSISVRADHYAVVRLGKVKRDTSLGEIC